MLNTILEAIYLDNRVHDLLKKLQPEDLRKDLLHHCIQYVAEVYERRPAHLEGMYERGELFAWFQRCLKVELTGKNSKFFRMMRRPPVELQDWLQSIPDIGPEDDITEYRSKADRLYGPGFWDLHVKKLEDRREKRFKNRNGAG
jgi:hypothetical protein